MSAVVEQAAQTAPDPRERAARRARRSVTLGVGLALVGLVVLVAALSFVWLPYAQGDTSGGRLQGPGGAHWLGTDRFGRDLTTQLMIGARIALAVGVGAVVVGAIIGIMASSSPASR